MIGFTVVVLGASLSELVMTVQAQRRGEPDLVVGNLFGSNLFNSLGGGAVVGLASRSGEPAGMTMTMAGVMVMAAVAA